MKGKRVFLFLAVGLLAIILLGSTLAQDTPAGSSDEYDTAFYVENSKNVFIVAAKMLDKCCYYVVDIVISSVSSVFNSILNN